MIRILALAALAASTPLLAQDAPPIKPDSSVKPVVKADAVPSDTSTKPSDCLRHPEDLATPYAHKTPIPDPSATVVGTDLVTKDVRTTGFTPPAPRVPGSANPCPDPGN